jgi:hypothetical protein
MGHALYLRAMDSTMKTSVKEEVHAYEQTKLKAKEVGFKKPTLERVDGDDLFRKTSTWHKITRVLDRKNDKYYELI